MFERNINNKHLHIFSPDNCCYRFTGILCNGGEHHGDHGHHHHHGGGVPATEELTDLIQNFGLAVLGKDQESASDVQPTADHSHINVKVRPGQVMAGHSSESVQEGAEQKDLGGKRA